MRARNSGRHVVALVDDDADYRALIRGWLEPHYDVVEFGDGAAFLASLQDSSPDATVLDLNLPEMDGFAVCRKAREHGVETPILFLTSSNDQDDFLRHLELAATGYLMKPIGRGQLLSRLAETIDGERSGAPSRRRDAPGWLSTGKDRHALHGSHKAI